MDLLRELKQTLIELIIIYSKKYIDFLLQLFYKRNYNYRYRLNLYKKDLKNNF
jgi:hypothetical protein